MGWRTCVLLGLLALVHGDYTPSPSVPGYTTPAVNSPLTSPHIPTVTYSAPTSAPYTTAGVLTQPSTPGTTVSTPSGDTPYSGAGQTDFHANNGYPYTYSVPDSYSPFYQKIPPQFISQYYKQPSSGFPNFQQVSSPSQTLNPPAFQPHSCTSSNNPLFHRQQPYFQSTLFQVPNPLSILNGFAPSNSFHAMVNPSSPRGPIPSPGYYTPNHTPNQPLFSVGYTSPSNRPLPYNVH